MARRSVRQARNPLSHEEHHVQAASEAGISAAYLSNCNDLRNEYDLTPGFTEADYMKAVGASEVMQTRRKYGLPAGFTEGQLIAAASKCTNTNYYYNQNGVPTYCYGYEHGSWH